MNTRVAVPATVIFDVDMTLVGIEGIDWLAAQRGPEIGRAVERLTTEAMDGRRALDSVYSERLALVAPTDDELVALGEAYCRALAPGAARCIAALRQAHCRIILLSGGLRSAILPVAHALGIADTDVHAVRLARDLDGRSRTLDGAQPLASANGKPRLVPTLGLPRPIVAVGDGATDLALRTEGTVDRFIAFTGFVARPAVMAGADACAADFPALYSILTGERT
jgi:phosphoserine phosphatase